MSIDTPFLTDHEELVAWLSLCQVPTLGPRTVIAIRERCGSLVSAWTMSERELLRRGVPSPVIEAITKCRETVRREVVEQQIGDTTSQRISFGESSYPALLCQLPDPPYLLWYRGTLDALTAPTLAVVGTRTPSAYGLSVTRTLVRDLAHMGVTIISGLALGIDGEAHEAALEAGGRTVAVLGTSLNDISPPRHHQLANRIIRYGGTLLSEYPSHTTYQKHHFPQRNRIIAGLSCATLVVEGAEDSGALITARCALDYDRDVLAVPGDIVRKTSAAPNRLISLGARLVASTDDVLETLQLARRSTTEVDKNSSIRNNQQSVPASSAGKQIFKLLEQGIRHVDELITLSGLPAQDATAAITELEMNGSIRHLGGMRYSRS